VAVTHTSDINLASFGSVPQEFARLDCVLKGQNYATLCIVIRYTAKLECPDGLTLPFAMHFLV